MHQAILSPLGRLAIVATIAASFAASVAAPVAVYTVTLAAFGLPHVLAELRFVDLRFSGRLARIGPALLVLLAGALLARIAGWAGLLAPPVAAGAELLCGAGLVFACLGLLRRRRVAVVAIGLALAAGAVLAPAVTLLAFAVAHNGTPLALVLDVTPANERRRRLALWAVPFLVGPALIVTGLPADLADRLGLWLPDLSPLGAGGFENHLGVYVAPALAGGSRAVDLFAAAVFAQTMHYGAVIHLLPRLVPANARGRIPWPRPAVFAAVLAACGLVLLVLFRLDFPDARRLYGLAALIHAWLEIPVMMLMLGAVSAEGVDEEAEAGGCAVGERREGETA